MQNHLVLEHVRAESGRKQLDSGNFYPLHGANDFPLVRLDRSHQATLLKSVVGAPR